MITNPYRNAPPSSNIAAGSEVAYSLRYISSSYSGDVILARRGGDDVEEGFTPTEVSDGTLTSWTSEGSGDGNGYIKTWYDQSGNVNDATQTNVANQPEIVISSVLNVTNGLPTIDFSNGIRFLTLTTSLDAQNAFTTFHVENYPGTGEGFVLGASGTNIPYTPFFASGTIYIANGDHYFQDSTPSTNSGQMIVSGFAPVDGITTGQDVRINGTAQTMTAQAFSDSTTNLSLLGRRNNTYSDSDAQEFIFFAGDNTANFSTIETDMNDYYSVYL